MSMCDLKDAFSGLSLSDQQMKVTKGHDRLLGSLYGKPIKKKPDQLSRKPAFTPMEEDTESESSSSSEEEESPRKVKGRISRIEKEHAILSEKLQSKQIKKRRQKIDSKNSRSSSNSHLAMPASRVRPALNEFHNSGVRSQETRAPDMGQETYAPPKLTESAFNQVLKRLLQNGLSNDRNVTTFVVIILMGLAALFIADKIFSLNGK